jgi:hypothetical protein
MGIFDKLFRSKGGIRSAGKGKKGVVVYNGKIDLQLFPVLDQRITLAKQIHSRFVNTFAHLIDEETATNLAVAKDGGLSVVYTLTTADPKTLYRVGKALSDMWDPYTVEEE